MLTITQTDETISRFNAARLTAYTPAEVRAAAADVNAAVSDWDAAVSEFYARLTAANGRQYDFINDGDMPAGFEAAYAVLSHYSDTLNAPRFAVGAETFPVKSWATIARQHRAATRKLLAALKGVC